MFSRVFIDRPIFAWVIAILIMMAGAGSILGLPVAQYPDVAPPQVSVRASYPGASAETIQNSVTQVIEQSLTGIDGLLYFSSSSTSRGQVTITATFEKGVDPRWADGHKVAILVTDTFPFQHGAARDGLGHGQRQVFLAGGF